MATQIIIKESLTKEKPCVAQVFRSHDGGVTREVMTVAIIEGITHAQLEYWLTQIQQELAAIR